MNMKFFTILLSIIFVASIAEAYQRKPYIVLKDNKKLLVQNLQVDEKGQIRFKAGKVTLKKKPGEYKCAYAPMPQNVKDAYRQFQAKKFLISGRSFLKAYKTAKYIGWGSFCIYYAAKASFERHKRADAFALLDKLKKVPLTPDDADYFTKAKRMEVDELIKDQKYDIAAKALNPLIKTNNAPSVMFANNAKGDIFTKQGNEAEALYMYMRNIILFNPDGSKESNKAIDRVIQILKSQNNPRATEFEKLKK